MNMVWNPCLLKPPTEVKTKKSKNPMFLFHLNHFLNIKASQKKSLIAVSNHGLPRIYQGGSNKNPMAMILVPLDTWSLFPFLFGAHFISIFLFGFTVETFLNPIL